MSEPSEPVCDWKPLLAWSWLCFCAALARLWFQASGCFGAAEAIVFLT